MSDDTLITKVFASYTERDDSFPVNDHTLRPHVDAFHLNTTREIARATKPCGFSVATPRIQGARPGGAYSGRVATSDRILKARLMRSRLSTRKRAGHRREAVPREPDVESLVTRNEKLRPAFQRGDLRTLRRTPPLVSRKNTFI